MPFGVIQDTDSTPAQPDTDNKDASAQNAALNQPTKDEYVDLNDPQLTSEVLTDDATASAYASLPPIPDGKRRAKLSIVDIDRDGKKVKFYARTANWKNGDGKPFFVVNVQAEMIEIGGKYDGYKLTDYWVTTAPRKSGTSQVAHVIRAAGVATPASATHVQMKDLVIKTLAAEPEAMVETQWEWQCQTCTEKAKKAGEQAPKSLRGMHKFAQRNGIYDPQMKCEVCGGYSVAQARIVDYLPLASAKK